MQDSVESQGSVGDVGRADDDAQLEGERPVLAPEHPDIEVAPSGEDTPDVEESAPIVEGAIAEGDETHTSGEDDVPVDGARFTEVNDRLDQLERTIAQSVALQEHQAALVQKLHAENQRLRQGELTQALKPFILDIARLHDDVAAVIERGGEELQKAAMIPEFILDVLDHQGVNPIAPQVGDSFDSKLHQGLSVSQTDDPLLDGCIASVERPGFIREGGFVIRPARVIVYRHSAPVVAVEPVVAVQGERTAADGQAEPPTSMSPEAGSREVG